MVPNVIREYSVPADKVVVSKNASSEQSVGDRGPQRAVAVRNLRSFLQVESNDLC
jgi:hypothetical protein